MSDTTQNASPAGTAGPLSCAVAMSDGEPCGRPTHSGPPGADPHPVCLMHSLDANKDKGQFRKEIDAILDGTSTDHRPDNLFDFTRFVFPEANFREATFTQNAHFRGATFTQNADFIDTTFTQKADFSWATFTQNAYFSKATFTQDADFNFATFAQKADFSEATFTQDAMFRWTKFTGDAYFQRVRFTEDAHFFRATFAEKAFFLEATFTRDASFSLVEFMGEVTFQGARLTRKAGFGAATFTQNAYFWETVFGLRAEPQEKAAPAAANSSPAIADFWGVRFERPTLVRFYRVNQESSQGLRARFLNCEVEGVHFEDLNWHREGDRMVLQDELDITSPQQEAESEQQQREREGQKRETRYRLVAITYRRLINNFEEVRDYDLAEDCYVGAMEMKRLDPAQPWFSRSAVTIYRWVSYYGSSYQRAALVLLIMLAAFGLLFAVPWAGLAPRPGSVPAVVSNALLAALKAFFAPWMHSLEVATFQRDTLVVTGTWFGRLVAMAENIFVPAQLALLLLALRRRFRR